MTRFSKAQKRYRWPQLALLLNERIGEEKTAALIAEAQQLSEQYQINYRSKKGYLKTHEEAAYNIAALYLPLKKQVGSEEAIRLLDEAWKPGALKKNASLDKIPPRLFMPICRKIVVTAFGKEAGFQQEVVSQNKNEVRFNIYACPYVRIMTELGCTEACPIVCRQDEYSYGGLRGVAFERTQTLGRGDPLCDFCYRLK